MTESRFLKALFDGMRCGILSLDADRKIQAINDQAVTMLGLDPRPEPGTPLDALAEIHPRLVQIFEESFGRGQLPTREEVVLGTEESPGGTIGYTLSHVSPDGTAPGLAMFFRDLTLIEQREEQERLKDRLAALGHMAASLAHEIRNPLASIDVTCSLMRRRLSDADALKFLEKITAEVRRLNATITSSLEFVRPMSLTIAPGDMIAVLEQAIEVARGRAGDRRIQIEANLDRQMPPIEMDASQVRQVFENLIVNAVEAVGDGGTVQLGSRILDGPGRNADTRVIEVRVSDDGPGIAADQTDKIFYPFYTTKDQGSGVGLSTVKKVIDSHNGEIDVKSGDNGGATFTVRLPIKQAMTEARDR